MRVDRDDDRARSNLIKHQVAFDVAVKNFDDPDALTVFDRVVDREESWRTVGRIGLTTILFAAHTWVDEEGEVYVRIIMARKTTRHEVQGYETGNERYLR